MIELLLGVICLIAGYLLKNSIKGELIAKKKYMLPIIIVCIVLGIGGFFNNEVYPLYGMFMYLWGNLL